MPTKIVHTTTKIDKVQEPHAVFALLAHKCPQEYLIVNFTIFLHKSFKIGYHIVMNLGERPLPIIWNIIMIGLELSLSMIILCMISQIFMTSHI
jgi:hypothetical protein